MCSGARSRVWSSHVFCVINLVISRERGPKGESKVPVSRAHAAAFRSREKSRKIAQVKGRWSRQRSYAYEGVLSKSPLAKRPAVAERRPRDGGEALERDKVGSRGGRREATRADAGGREAIAMKYLRKRRQPSTLESARTLQVLCTVIR